MITEEGIIEHNSVVPSEPPHSFHRQKSWATLQYAQKVNLG
jgi:hypothetical protein